VRDGDQMIDISSAAHGTSSTVPHSTTQIIFPFPGTAYRFDPSIIHWNDTKYDVNDAKEKLLSKMK
jgi:hypothetical protein